MLEHKNHICMQAFLLCSRRSNFSKQITVLEA